MNLAITASLPDRSESAQLFLVRIDALAALTAHFESGVRARTLLTRIGVSRAVAMTTGQALGVWLTRRQPTVGELVTVLVGMFERDAARALGLVELYDEIVTESESYDGDPAPLRRGGVGAPARWDTGLYVRPGVAPDIIGRRVLLRNRLTSARPGTPLHSTLSAPSVPNTSAGDRPA